MIRNGLLLASLVLLAACSSPSFLGDDASASPSFLGDAAPALTLESPHAYTASHDIDYTALPADVAAFLSDSAPPPVVIHAPAATAAPALATPPASGNPLTERAYAYLQALFRGDGETAWRHATVAPNPAQSWWDSNTAKGALLMKAGSSEYFAAEKRGVEHIDIPAHSISQHGNDVRLIARITYGNGSHSDMNLRLVHQGGQWLVAEE